MMVKAAPAAVRTALSAGMLQVVSAGSLTPIPGRSEDWVREDRDALP
jgi:hypothetical protein